MKAYAVLAHAVGVGVEHGYERAKKYREQPDRATIVDEIQQAVLDEVCEWFGFDDEGEPL